MQFYSRTEKGPGGAQAAVEVGNYFQRVQVLNVTETAKIVGLCNDYYGVPHVQFTLTSRLGPKIMDCENRMLAVEVFLETYRPVDGNGRSDH